jgi:hypothetical protein
MNKSMTDIVFAIQRDQLKELIEEQQKGILNLCTDRQIKSFPSVDEASSFCLAAGPAWIVWEPPCTRSLDSSNAPNP